MENRTGKPPKDGSRSFVNVRRAIVDYEGARFALYDLIGDEPFGRVVGDMEARVDGAAGFFLAELIYSESRYPR